MLNVAFLLVVSLSFFIHEAQGQTSNSLSRKEKEEGWILLFNGENAQGWQRLTGKGWIIENGELKAIPSEPKGQHDLISVEKFDSFELKFEFKLFKFSNSGIKYWVGTDYSVNKNQFLGLEYQLLDDANFIYPDRGIFRSTASLYDLIPAIHGTTLALDKWHSGRIIVKKTTIQHWLNGVKTIEVDTQSDAFRALVIQSKYRELERFGKPRMGVILLQNEGSPISFRNIKIKRL